MGRWSLHPGWDVDKNVAETIVEEIIEEVIPENEEVIDFNPEAAATDGNPFPEELATADTTNYESMTVVQLRAILEERALTVRGTKAELIARLEADDAGPSDEAPDESVETPSEEAVLSEENALEGEVSESGEQQESN
jgi:hypothetical protein